MSTVYRISYNDMYSASTANGCHPSPAAGAEPSHGKCLANHGVMIPSSDGLAPAHERDAVCSAK